MGRTTSRASTVKYHIDVTDGTSSSSTYDITTPDSTTSLPTTFPSFIIPNKWGVCDGSNKSSSNDYFSSVPLSIPKWSWSPNATAKNHYSSWNSPAATKPYSTAARYDT